MQPRLKPKKDLESDFQKADRLKQLVKQRLAQKKLDENPTLENKLFKDVTLT